MEPHPWHKDLLHPLEASVAGGLFAIHGTFIVNSLAIDGFFKFFTYWSCWNYVINAVLFYLLLIARRPGALRTWIYLITPYALALDLLWAGLTTMIVLLGSGIMTDYLHPGLQVADIARAVAAVYLHFMPVIVWGIFYGVHLRDIRDTYSKRVLACLQSIGKLARFISIVLIFWVPWLFFLLYLIFFNPYEVYEINSLSKATKAAAICASLGIYSVIMTIILVFIYMKREPGARLKARMTLRFAQIKQ